MRVVFTFLLAIVLAHSASAACPASQPTHPVDVSSGGKVCVPVAPGAPVSSVTVVYTGAMGETVTDIYLPTPPLTQFTDGSVVDIAATPEIRGPGSVVLTSIGPGGQGVSPVLAVIFRSYELPTAPILMP